MSFWDLSERAQKFAMELSICGSSGDRQAIAQAVDDALIRQPDRQPNDTVREVLDQKGVRCGRRDDGTGRAVHIEHPGSCATRLTGRLLDALRR